MWQWRINEIIESDGKRHGNKYPDSIVIIEQRMDFNMERQGSIPSNFLEIHMDERGHYLKEIANAVVAGLNQFEKDRVGALKGRIKNET